MDSGVLFCGPVYVYTVNLLLVYLSHTTIFVQGLQKF